MSRGKAVCTILVSKTIAIDTIINILNNYSITYLVTIKSYKQCGKAGPSEAITV